MTEKELRSKVVETAKSYFGIAEGSAQHREILSIYNNHKDPHRRSYTMTVSDAWCMTFVSACFIKAGLADLIVTECGCGEAVERNRTYKNNWVENDSYKPSAGDIIMYDWDDYGSGDNTGWPDHTGIVESCDGSTITIIEGNCSDTVKRRTLAVNGRYIRGFITPDFACKSDGTSQETTETEEIPTDPEVKASYGGAVSISLNTLKKNSKGPMVKTVQRIILCTGIDEDIEVDGSFGPITEAAVIDLQKKLFPDEKDEWDGVVGPKTWSAMLKELN